MLRGHSYTSLHTMLGQSRQKNKNGNIIKAFLIIQLQLRGGGEAGIVSSLTDGTTTAAAAFVLPRFARQTGKI